MKKGLAALCILLALLICAACAEGAWQCPSCGSMVPAMLGDVCPYCGGAKDAPAVPEGSDADAENQEDLSAGQNNDDAVILSVNGETVNKRMVANTVAYYQQQYSQYNSFDSQLGVQGQYPTDAATILDMVLDDQKKALVARQQAVKLGLDRFTEEELAGLQQKAEEAYQGNLEFIKSDVLVTDKLGDELEEEAKAYADAHGASLEDFLKDARNRRLLEKIESYVKDPVTVTDEDVRKARDERVESEKASYEADKTVFGSNLNNGGICCYAPEGYRYVKHILIAFAEEDAAAITAAKTALDEARAQTASAKEALAAAQAAYDEALAAAAANIRAKADEVYALASAKGADFDALMAEYGEDPGMKHDPAMTNGYAVCEGFPFVEPFLTQALALENEGDVSGLVLTNYGYHIIKYVAAIPEGIRMTVEEAGILLADSVLHAKQDQAYANALEQWISESDIRIYPERMGY